MAEQRVRKVSDPFQWRVFARILTYGLIYQVTVWNLMFCWRLANNKGALLAQYREFVYESYPMLFCVLLLVPAFAWDAVKFCHRIAGPVYRFRVTVRDVAAGLPVKVIRLRKGDELLGLRDDLNTMLKTLSARGAIDLIDGGQPSLPTADTAGAAGRNEEAETAAAR